VGRVLGSQGLVETPIDTSGFQSILKLVGTTTADSFDLFYGLYKFNLQNSKTTIDQLQAAMNDVVMKLKSKEESESEELRQKEQQQQQQEDSSSTLHPTKK
jgi:arogenate dehydrogenase (NADP+)